MQNRSTIAHIMEAYNLPVVASSYCVYFLLELKRVDVRLEKKKMKLHKEKLKKTYNLVQNQEQVAVSSATSVMKTSTSSCCSGKNRMSSRSSSSGSREWTHSEISELIAI